MAGKGIYAKHLTAKGWRFKRERGTNRAGTRSHGPRILLAGSRKRSRARLETIARKFAREMKGKGK